VDFRQFGEFEWTQPAAFSRSYELRAGDGVAARLKFENMFGSKAAAQAGDAGWTFKRTGFFSPKVTVRTDGSDRDIALYEPGWTGTKGTLILSDGSRLLFRASNFWNTAWVLEREGGAMVLELHTHGVVHHSATIRVADDARERADLPLLAALCWYILLLYISDAAGASVVTMG
jgi:hypothetical protein